MKSGIDEGTEKIKVHDRTPMNYTVSLRSWPLLCRGREAQFKENRANEVTASQQQIQKHNKLTKIAQKKTGRIAPPP